MNIFVRLVGAILLGALVSLYSLQFNKRFVHYAHIFFKEQFEKNFLCQADYELDQVNILAFKIRASSLSVQAPDHASWYWIAKKICLTNYWPWIFKKKMGLRISLKDVEAFSFVSQNYLLIWDHLKNMMIDTQDIPIALKQLSLENILFKAQSLDQPWDFLCNFNGDIHCHAARMKMKMFIQNGMMRYQNFPLFENLIMSLYAEKDETKKNEWSLHAEGKFFTALNDFVQEYFLNFYAKATHAQLNVTHKNNDFNMVATADVPQQSCHMQSAGNFRNFSPYFKKIFIDALEGFFSIGGDYSFKKESGGITCDVQDLKINGCHIERMQGSLSISKDEIQGSGIIRYDSDNFLQGSLAGNSQGDMTVFFNNPHMLTLTKNLYIPDKAINVAIYFKNFKFSHATLSTIFYLDHKEYYAQAMIQYDAQSKTFIIQGSVGDYSFTCIIDSQNYSIKDIQLDWLHQKIFHLKNNEPNILSGVIDVSILKHMLQYYAGIELRGGVPITVTLEKKQHKVIMKFSFQNAHVQIPGTYNFVQDFSLTVVLDLIQRTLKIKDGYCQLHKGNMSVKRGILHIGGIWYMHIPLILTDIFFNRTQEAVGFLSGSCLISGSVFKPECVSNLSLDQGSCKYVDIHSWLKGSLGMSFLRAGNINIPIKMNVNVKTQSPLHIDIPFMQAQCVSNMHIFSYNHDVNVEGGVTIIAGTLHFPYRSLYITHGRIVFMPQHINDPLIELVARGRIKKYQVIMRITGSLQQPDVHLESIPSLQDEQIITLLLSGSDKGSFAFAMPSVLLHNAHKWVFPKKEVHNSSKFQHYIRGFLEPFRHIRIIPSFIDQTSRGGFRGAIEITVSERLRAIIQKNFSLTEDTKLEVEYALSDDIMLRAIRDERGDLGGEVEMRWKF